MFIAQFLSKVTVTPCSLYIKCSLTNGTINETLRHTLDISQGSVATNFRCDGIFDDSIITNFLLILKVV